MINSAIFLFLIMVWEFLKNTWDVFSNVSIALIQADQEKAEEQVSDWLL